MVVAPEHRCAPYRASDYPYPQSVEPRIIAGIGRVFGAYTGRSFASRTETDIEHMVARSEAHDSGALRRRSQRDRFAWKRMERMTELQWPKVTIRHPWPDRRFAVKHPRQEPCALPGMHGFRAGGVG